MDPKHFLDGMRKFGSTMEEICLNTLGLAPEKINETVIISPPVVPGKVVRSR